MISTNNLKNGMVIDLDGSLYSIVEFQHVKPGKGGAFVRTKLKNVKTGAVIDRTFRAGEKLEDVRLENRKMQYLYSDGDILHFMDNESYEQIELNKDMIGDGLKYLKEGMSCDIAMHEAEAIGVEVPMHVELEVIETDPGLKGDTASGGTKPAKLETGAVVQVPLFIEVGEKIRVDTRTNSYITRV